MAATTPPDGPETPNRADTPSSQPDKEQLEQAAAAVVQLLQQVAGAFRRQQQTPAIPSQPSASQGAGNVDRAAALWLLGLVPLVLVCFHLMVVSRGDAETLRSLVQNINVTSLVLGTILPLGSTALTWWLLLSLLVKITRPKPQRKPNWVLSLIMLTVFVVFVDFFAMPLLYGVINLAIFVAFLVCIVVLGLLVRVLSRTGAGPAGQPRLQKIMGRTQMANQFLARFWALVLFLGPLLIWLGFMGVWLPQERLKIGPAKVEPAYVISIDDRWTKYMDGAHKVHIVPTKDVIGRETVSKPGTWRKTLLDLWHEWWDNDNKARPGAPGTTTAVPTPPASPPPIAPAPATSLPSPSAPLPSAPPSLTQPAPSPTTAR